MTDRNELLYALDDLVDDIMTGPDNAYQNCYFATPIIKHICALAYDHSVDSTAEALKRSNDTLEIIKLVFKQAGLSGFQRFAHFQIEQNKAALLASEATPEGGE